MLFVSIHEAKTNLSQYLARITTQHETVVICRNGEPIAKLMEYQAESRVKFGLLQDRIKMDNDFNEEFPEEIMCFSIDIPCWLR